MKSPKGENKEQQIPALILEKYLLKETIGKGTFSKVKLGIKREGNMKVAIKILEKSKIVSKDDSERVRRELDIISKLSHLNVIQTNEIINCKDQFFIIMEYCEGGELFNHIVRKQRLSEDEAACFYYQLINGLEYIHANNVAHRDLKPENLLLSKGNVLKIIDFGLSNYFEGKLLSTPCGSPCYASPEMVSGKKYNGFTIDIWSSGIILFAMLCGYLPFEDENNEVLFKKILQCKLHYPSHVSIKSKGLLQKLLMTDPEKRIKLKEIKSHPFYLRGEFLFNLSALLNSDQSKRKETFEDNKYTPYFTETNDAKQLKEKSKKQNDKVMETEVNAKTAIGSLLKEKIYNLQSIICSPNKVRNYDSKTVSTNETGHCGSRSNTLSAELRSTIREAKEKKPVTSPKSTSVTSTIDSNKSKQKGISYLISPLSSLLAMNKQQVTMNNSRMNTEQGYSNIYKPAKPQCQQTPSSVTKTETDDYLTFRNTFNCIKKKDNLLNSKKIQLPSSYPYSKPIITHTNFLTSHLTERKANVKNTITNISDISDNLSFFQNYTSPKQKTVNVNSLLPEKKTSTVFSTYSINFDSLNNRKSTIAKGYNFNSLAKSFHYQNLKSDLLNHKLAMTSKQKDDPLYLITETHEKYKTTSTKVNEANYGKNAPINPVLSFTPKKPSYYTSNLMKSTTNKATLSNSLHYLQRKGFY